MKALLLSDEQVDWVTEQVRQAGEYFQSKLEAFGDYEQADIDRYNRLSEEVAAAPAIELGGLAGMLVTFGDGCDDDTIQTVFGRCIDYSVEVSLADGRKVEGKLVGVGWTIDVDLTDDAHDWGPTGNVDKFDVDTVTGIHIF